jgi:hypothetical protein
LNPVDERLSNLKRFRDITRGGTLFMKKFYRLLEEDTKEKHGIREGQLIVKLL